MSSEQIENAERLRLEWEARREPGENWKRWGPYMSERQWGTVREDYSHNGQPWDYFKHDDARIGGEKTACWAFAIGSVACALLWHCGMAKIRFSRNVCSVPAAPKAITVRTSRSSISIRIRLPHIPICRGCTSILNRNFRTKDCPLKTERADSICPSGEIIPA
jgi:hypothetical protein